ncbi:MAG: peptidoglycan DD-metalloendopeptidase family protein [Bacteroidales bacterium]|jgi:murein DD-endopeptidase MepM/ murein hydrolase activator NlpD|nr:peptidoglycan DD-metalloendopeptidase family protein [Bacteroidales bacterium]NLM93747.1 peptidoglycan DD-metalloendopeptidase family protein [Bacteroidales bacterium]
MTDKTRPRLLTLVIVISLAVLLVFGFLLIRRFSNNHHEQDVEEVQEIVLDDFGFPEGGFLIESEVVRSNQTLSHILSSFSLSPDVIHLIAERMQEVFNPRRIKAGQNYHGYYTNDSVPQLQYFIYEISTLDYLKVGFGDSLLVEKGEKQVTTLEKSASGMITSSLWNTMVDNNLSPELIIRIAEVLAWEVDFHRVQKGDRFKVIFKEDFVGDKSVGVPSVDAVYFVNQGREIYGFHFESDTIQGFFNPEGESLRKVFLKAPLEFGRISSRFSHSRMHPVLKHRRPHYGTDYAAPHGTPILSVGDGVVTQAAYTSGNGNYVRIRHNSVYETQYLHMSRFASGIRPGTKVTQGQVIGYVGATGLATGPHVCFRFWKNGQQVDHLREEFPSADPLPAELHSAFLVIRDSLALELDKIPFREENPV